MTTKEQAARRELFYTALRSGRFKKIRSFLVKGDTECCVMGVGTVVALENGAPITRDFDGFRETESGNTHRYTCMIPPVVAEWYGFDSRTPKLGDFEATYLNDYGGKTLPELADLFDIYHPAIATE